MFTRIFGAAIAAGVLLSGAASAATITFSGGSFVDQDGTTSNIFDVTLMDVAGGVSVDIARSGAANGDIYLIGFEGVNFAATDISAFSSNTTDTVAAVCHNVKVCSGGVGTGFNGGSFNSFTFDTLVQIGDTGSSSGLNNDLSFNIAGIMTSDISALGFRVQTVSGVGSATSLKIINDDPTTPPVSDVPLPASVMLLLGGLGGLVAMRKRTRV